MRKINATNLYSLVLVSLLVVFISFNTNGQTTKSPTQLLCQEIVQVPVNYPRVQELFQQGEDINCQCDVIQRTYFIEMDRIMINFFSNSVSEVDLKANSDDNYLIERVSVSPLQIALSREDYSLMRFLIDNGADLNRTCCDGMFPLEYAFHHNKKDLVDFLLENGANPKIIELGCPFDIDMAKYMISKGANRNTIKIDCALWDKERALALLQLRPDLKGESIGDFDFDELLNKPKLLSFLLNNGFSYNGVNNNIEKKTLLHLAAEHNKIEIIELLLKYKSPINAKDAKGCTPLCYAVKANHYDVVKLLLSEGATINLSLPQNSEFTSPLSMAVRQRNLAITRLLLENGANSGLAGEDLLAIAVKNDDREIVAQLVKYGDEPSRLLQLYGSEYLYDDTNLFEFVLGLGALSHEDSNNFTLKAVKEGKEEVASVLIKHKTGLNSTDSDGKSPLHYAFINSNFTLAYQLIEAGADVNQQVEGFAPFLHRAVATKNMVMVHKLLQNGAQIDILNEFGKTALSIAINEKDYELAKLLLKYDIPIDCEDLFRAIHLEHFSMVKLLVENNVDLSCEKDKLTPVSYAKKHNISYHIEQYLKGK